MSKKGGTQRLETASTPGLGLKACTCHHADRDCVAVSSGSAADVPPQTGMETLATLSLHLITIIPA